NNLNQMTKKRLRNGKEIRYTYDESGNMNKLVAGHMNNGTHLAQIIKEFDLNWAYVGGNLFTPGKYGSESARFGEYFSTHGIKFKSAITTSVDSSWWKNGGVYVITYWNDKKDITQGIHTVAAYITGGKFEVYNDGGQANTYTSFSKIYGNGKLIRFYRLGW
ncbi:MAG: hypothetical protein K0R90_1252, partial [Oscillospiraceae bacterium]|nr:hypothetical protein [Oscillospiraceae bacterium]